jgi:deazaflavin-dependent oxidoreductase (nitroreductase family)
MPVPKAVTQLNKKYLNRFMIRLAGLGPLVEVEHVGRRSGTVRRAVIMAFRRGDVVTIALTYGPDVDWLKNIRAAGGCRMHLGSRLLTLGPPRTLDAAEGLRRMPLGPRAILPLLRSEDYIELPVLADEPLPAKWKRS